MITSLRRIISKGLSPLVFIIAIFLIFEEWIWDQLTQMMSAISRWTLFRILETQIRKLSPKASLVLFIMPGLVLIPFKLFAVALVAQGHVLGGLAMVLLAKVTSTTIVAQLFAITREKVLTIRWFFWIYQRVIVVLGWAHQWLHRSRPYLFIKCKTQQLKAWWLEIKQNSRRS